MVEGVDDALAIPGGFEEFGFYEEAYNEQLLELIRLFDSKEMDRNSLRGSFCLLGKVGC